MIKIKCIYTIAIYFVLLSQTAVAASAFGTASTVKLDKKNPTRLMGWAESTFPTLFLPAEPPVQTIKDQWVYRFYDKTNTAIGVKDNKNVFVTGEPFAPFGELIPLGLLTELLIAGIDHIPSNIPKNNCLFI